MTRNERRAGDAPGAFVVVHLAVAVRVRVELCTVDVVKIDRQAGEAARGGFFRAEPHVGHLGISVRGPGNDQRACTLAAVEQSVLQHDACHRIGSVCELVAGADIAGGVDAAVRGAEPRVDDYALFVELDSGGLQAEAFHVRPAADGQQDRVHVEPGGAIPAVEIYASSAIDLLDAVQPYAELHIDAFQLEALLHDGGGASCVVR